MSAAMLCDALLDAGDYEFARQSHAILARNNRLL
jgi:hypothetical protein